MTSPVGRTPAGVLVMAHGTPAGPGEVEAFYTSIRRGHPPTPDLLADLVRRYDAIGGTSPLAARTRAQVDGLAAVLDARDPGTYVVRYGAKHTVPRIEDGIRSLHEAGVHQVVGLVLTPHRSAAGSEQYQQRASQAAAEDALRYVDVPSWHRAPGLAELLADRVTATLAQLGPGERERVVVCFTAHSVPERALAGGDPYAEQVHQSADDIATRCLGAASGATWCVAWQSAGRTADRWLGPGLLDEIRRVAGEGATAVVVCPVGFVADHLEVLYDLDVEAAGVARSLGLGFARTASLNDDPRFLGILADVVEAATRSRDVGTGEAPVAGST